MQQGQNVSSVAMMLLAARLSTFSSALLVGHIELLQILVQPIGEKNLASTLPRLHLHDHLATGHFDLLLLHTLTSLLHLVDLFLMATLLSLTLFPLLVCDASHDLHRFLRLFLLFFKLTLMMIFDLFLARLSLLLYQAVLQPVLEGPVTLLLLNLFLKPFLFLLTQLLLLLQGFGHKFALFPLEHTVSALLVFFVEGCLLHDHLLEQVLFSLKDKHLA